MHCKLSSSLSGTTLRQSNRNASVTAQARARMRSVARIGAAGVRRGRQGEYRPETDLYIRSPPRLVPGLVCTSDLPADAGLVCVMRGISRSASIRSKHTTSLRICCISEYVIYSIYLSKVPNACRTSKNRYLLKATKFWIMMGALLVL